MKTKKVRLLFSLLLLWMAMAVQGQTLLNNVFNDVSEFETYSVEDANGDGQQWHYDDLILAACCDRDFDADDWLFTPALNVVEGKTYRLTVAVSIDNEGDEVLAVMMGQSASSSAMTASLIEETTLSGYQQQLTATFKATSSGNSYIGFHYATPDDGFSNRVYLNSIKVEETADEGVPAGVTGLTLTPGAGGALKATVSFKAPTLSITGSSLVSLTKIEVRRDDQLVNTFEAPAVGSQLSFEDAGMASGMHTYCVTAFNEKGEGEEVEEEVYIGVDQIGAIENVRFVYDCYTHKSTITWDVPTKGMHGGYIDTSSITYNIRRYYANAPLQTGLTETTFEDEIGIEYLHEVEDMLRQQYAEAGMNVSVNFVVDGQGLMVYYVQAVTDAGAGEETQSNAEIIGDPNVLPYHETFAQGNFQHYWRTDIRNKRARWTPVQDGRYSQDGDTGFLAFTAMEGEETATCHTGNIVMTDATSPVLAFHVYCPVAMASPLLVKVSKNGGELETIESIPLDNTANLGHYFYVSIPLTGCAGVDLVKVGFEASLDNTVELVYIDNVRIFDQKMKDLSVEVTSVPKIVKVGESKYMTATVENMGLEDVSMGGYTLNAYIDGQLAGMGMGMPVKVGEKAVNMISIKPTIDMQKQTQLYVELVYDGDEALANNRSELFDVKVRMPNLPEAQNLKAAAGDGVVLSWDAPAPLRTSDETVTEGFEEYDDFAMSDVGEWSMVDADQGIIYGFSQYSYPIAYPMMSYIVFNPSQVDNESGGKGMSESDAALWEVYNGEKMLASFSRQGPCEDWLISPELTGNPQVISFYARHTKDGGVEYPESFQLYISMEGNDNFLPYDLTPVITTYEWKKYEYTLPQNTKYFAICKVSDDKWAFLLDDITFAPDTLASQQGAIFYGYNVYKNGSQLNGALVSQPSFIDADGKDGDTYRVTAVYNRGESGYSNTVVYGNGSATGIDHVSWSENASAPTIHQPSTFYDLQGRRLSGITGKGIVIVNKRKIVVR